jgi:hypothetical protein
MLLSIWQASNLTEIYPLLGDANTAQPKMIERGSISRGMSP